MMKTVKTFEETTYEERLALVREMDDTARNIDDEDAVFLWLTYGCPDCSTEEDYEFFAEDEEEYMELRKLFEFIMKDEK